MSSHVETQVWSHARASRPFQNNTASALSSSLSAQADEYITDVNIVLTYSATTSCPQLGMDGVPGYTFSNGGPGACRDGWFPIDGRLLGNSYRASGSLWDPDARHLCAESACCAMQ